MRRPLTLMMMRKTLSRELSIQKQMSSVVDYRRLARTFCCSRLLIRYAHSHTHTHRYEGYKTVNRRHPGCITPGLCAGQSVRFGLYVRLITRALLKLPLSIHHVRGTYCLFNVLLLELICIVYFLLMSCSTSKLCSVDINVL